jgi:hypothetical protein
MSGTTHCPHWLNARQAVERLKSLDEFKRQFEEVFPFRIEMANLLVAGGSPAGILRDQALKDVDLFIYGLATTEEATQRVRRLLDELESSYRAKLIAEHQKQLAVQTEENHGGSRKTTKRAASATDEKWEPKYHVQLIRSRNAITVQIDNKHTVPIILRL